MKKLLIFVFMLISLVHAQTAENKLSIFSKASATEVELKWLMSEYSSKYEYKVFRSIEGGEPKYLDTVKPTSYEVLEKRGYSEDNIFMIYPEKHIKNIDDRIKYLQTQGTTDAFRVLWMMKDKQFAKNIGHYFMDKTVKPDTKYLYYVGAYKDGKRVFTSKIKVYTSANNFKSDFKWVDAKSAADGVELSWSVEDEFNYYNVYRKLSTEQEFTKINKDLLFRSKEYAKKAKVLYKDKELRVGEKATYFIRKVDMFSEEGMASIEVRGTIQDELMPQPVKDVYVKSTDKKITIRWRHNPDAISYDVYRSTITAGNFVKINKEPIKKEVYIDTDFKVEKEYYYYVVANNLQGSSIPSMKMLAFARDTTPPSSPTDLKTKVEKSDIHLSWKAPSEKDVVGYRLYIATDEYTQEWNLMNQELIKETSFLHKRSEKLDKNTYYYRVSALDKKSNESDVSNIVAVKLPDVTPPMQPDIFRTNVYPQKIFFEWSKIIVDDLSHYNIYKKGVEGIQKLNKENLYANSFEYNDPEAEEFTYIVTAVDKAGNESLKDKGRVLKTIDQIPVTLSELKYEKTKEGYKISFVCNDKDYNGFELLRSSGSDKRYYNISNFQEGKSFEDKGFSDKVDNFYKVKAYDKAGNVRESKILRVKASK